MSTVSQVRRKVSKRTRLQALREEANLTLREVAKHSGVSAPTVLRTEVGKSPDVRTALLLARFYETSVEDLFGHLAEKGTRP